MVDKRRISMAASELGKQAKGRPKRITEADAQARRERLARARQVRLDRIAAERARKHSET